ncbi:unnamed protein product [Wuchereria bancrofti]|nr:unnamed protein product [Wuchereria bancrofti]
MRQRLSRVMRQRISRKLCDKDYYKSCDKESAANYAAKAITINATKNQSQIMRQRLLQVMRLLQVTKLLSNATKDKSQSV